MTSPSPGLPGNGSTTAPPLFHDQLSQAQMNPGSAMWANGTGGYDPMIMPGNSQQQQQQQLNQLMQHQHLAPLVGQQISSLVANQQQPSLNMVLQQPQLLQAPHGPPNSAGIAQQGLFYLQPGAGRLDAPGGSRGDMNPSPNSSVAGPHPPGPSQTPPNALLDIDRSWQQQANQGIFLGGPRFGMNDKTLMEDHLKQAHEMFQDPSLAAVQDRATQIAVMQQQQEMARLNQFAVNQQFHHFMGPPPPTSPPMHHQQPPPMPPRPRPEGSQEPSTHFMSGDFNERGQHKSHDQLVIDSWTNEDNEKVNQNAKYGMRDESRKDDKFSNAGMAGGWGGPPPANPSGWGAAKTPNTGNWQQPPQQMRGGHQSQNLFRGGFNRGSGVGAGGGAARIGGFEDGQLVFDPNRGRGMGMRGGRAMGRGMARGRGGFSSHDHSQEKQDGKKSAIAETIAMMSKMKMEDKERKESHQKNVEARKQQGLAESPFEFLSNDEELPQDRFRDDHRRSRGGGDRGGRGRGRGGGRGGGMRGGMPMGPMGGGLHTQLGAQPMGPGNGLFMPTGAGAIPPFPGLEGFLPPHGIPPFPGGPFPPYGPAGFFPHLPPGVPPNLVGGARGGFPRGGRGQFPMGFPARGGGFPRGAGPMMGGVLPRGRGRGGLRGAGRFDNRSGRQREEGEGQREEGEDGEEKPEVKADEAEATEEDTEKASEPTEQPLNDVGSFPNNGSEVLPATESNEEPPSQPEATSETAAAPAAAPTDTSSPDGQPEELSSGQVSNSS